MPQFGRTSAAPVIVTLSTYMFWILLGFGSPSPAIAQCSTITGPGMSSGGPCPPPRRVTTPTPSGANVGAGNSYSGYGGNSGNNAAAAVGAAGAVLGILGNLIDESERQAAADRSNAAAAIDEQARRNAAARQALCESAWTQAWSAITQASAIARDDPGTAVHLYNQARVLLGQCGDNKSRSYVRKQQEEAQRRHAAITEDGRVHEAQRRFRAGNLYENGGPNPFGLPAAKAAAQESDKSILKISPADVLNQAKARCGYAANKPAEWKGCMQTQEARLIAEAHSEIKLACNSEKDPASRERCIVNAYVRKIEQAAANPSGAENCYYDAAGRQCYPGGGGNRPSVQTASLREQLRNKLREQRLREGRSGEVSEAELSTAESLATATAPPVAAPPVASSSTELPKEWNRDDPLQHYLNSRNSSTGARNDGSLGSPQPGMTGLMPDPRVQRQGECLRSGGKPETCR